MNERCDPCAEFTITLTGKQANYLFDAIDCFDYALLTILPRQQYQELKEKLDLLNNRPRRCINYRTPNELINEYITQYCT